MNPVLFIRGANVPRKKIRACYGKQGRSVEER
jgi:hypothetical protein